MAEDERRVHSRYRLWLPARIEDGEEPHLAVGHDMSQKGSLLVTNRELEVGARIVVFVRVPPDAEEEREIGATVVRCGPNAADPDGLWPFQIAIEFDKADPDLEELLREQTAVLEGLSEG
jgi:PilZ domain